MSASESPLDFVVCGETLIDMIQQPDGKFEPVTGGSPKNTATALGRIGNKVGLISRVGKDSFGNLIREQLSESHVDMRYLQNTDEPTTLAFASIDASGSASYNFYIEGCADGTWTPSRLNDKYLSAKFCVVAGSFSLVVPTMSETFERFFDDPRNPVVVFDPNIRPILATDRNVTRQRMERWISKSTIVKASTEDVEWAYPGIPGDVVAKDWLAKGPSLVAITDGGNGAAIYTEKHSATMAAPVIDVIDTVGAGDTFTAGLVDWLNRNEILDATSISDLGHDQIQAALDFAILLAAETCKQQGANPPWERPAN